MKNIVIVGAGFGGIAAALTLEKHKSSLPEDYRIILIDRRDHILYAPALYEIAAIPREITQDFAMKSSIMIPLKDVVGSTSITFIQDTLEGLDRVAKKIRLQKTGELPYEYLILALGSETNYFSIPGLQEHSYTIKTFDDAVRMRNAIENKFKQKDALTIIVGGAGSTGVELVAELVNFVCALRETKNPHPNICSVFFTLVEASPDILPGFPAPVMHRTRKRLEQLGIKIKTSMAIASVSMNEIIYKEGTKDSYDVLIWAGGVKGPSLLQTFGFPLTAKGALSANKFLITDGSDGSVYAIGDNATYIHPKTQKPLVWNVQAAEAEAHAAAGNILRSVRGQKLEAFNPPEQFPFILAVGKKYAIADLVYIRLTGFVGWMIKHLAELWYLLGILPMNKACATWWTGIKIYSSNDY